jgi:large subunit ribosomal protein L25
MSDKQYLTIEATTRTAGGKSAARKMRRAGKIPAILNSQGKSTKLELDPKLLSKSWQLNDKKFNLAHEGKTQLVKITELQIDPVKRLALHIDLAPVVD